MINGINSLTQSNQSKDKSTNNTFDKDMFLKVLVAQMKYQNPLEQTSNLDSITQYATFSQAEQMSNLASTMEIMMADNMIDKNVTIKDDKTEISGLVERITHENNKAYVHVNGNKYLASKVTGLYK